jgi:mannosyl-3-phosphoglycerate synthase
MRLNYKDESIRLGSFELNALSQVTELDSGLITGPSIYKTLDDGSINISFSHSSLQAIEKQLAIVVPYMNEEYSILEGVLRGIPHDCFIILVSNSETSNFVVERKILTRIRKSTGRQGIAVHQQDPDLARAFSEAGMPHIVNKKAISKLRCSAGRIRNGKGEAMMIGTALAKVYERAFVGFIDADNFVPGVVHEYCKVLAAGLHHVFHSRSAMGCDDALADPQPLAMVRIKWKYKPKIVDGKLILEESGRCSRVVNAWMNRLLASVTGGDSSADLIRTANAGEHAISTDLALQLNFATGYAVEPFQLINLWERSSAFLPTPPRTPPRSRQAGALSASLAPLRCTVKILQIETLNPHIHDFGKGEEHIGRMQAQGLSTIYHSLLTPWRFKEKLQEYMKKELRAFVGEDGVPEEARVYPTMEGMDFEVFRKLLSKSPTLTTSLSCKRMY